MQVLTRKRATVGVTCRRDLNGNRTGSSTIELIDWDNSNDRAHREIRSWCEREKPVSHVQDMEEDGLTEDKAYSDHTMKKKLLDSINASGKEICDGYVSGNGFCSRKCVDRRPWRLKTRR